MDLGQFERNRSCLTWRWNVVSMQHQSSFFSRQLKRLHYIQRSMPGKRLRLHETTIFCTMNANKTLNCMYLSKSADRWFLKGFKNELVGLDLSSFCRSPANKREDLRSILYIVTSVLHIAIDSNASKTAYINIYKSPHKELCTLHSKISCFLLKKISSFLPTWRVD